MYVCNLAIVVGVIDIHFYLEALQSGVCETAQYKHRGDDDYRGSGAHQMPGHTVHTYIYIHTFSFTCTTYTILSTNFYVGVKSK